MAYERTWAFSYNNQYTPTSFTDQTKYQLWALKAMLLGQYGGLTQGLWTTYSSCDGAGNFGNGDLVDWWGSTYDPTKIVQANSGQPHSWYVLKSPLMNGFNFYLLIATATPIDASASATLVMAKIPFAGGTNTVNPTSADSWALFATSSTWNSGTGANVLNRFNMALSATGDFVYFPVQSGIGHIPLCVAVIAPVGIHPSDGYPIWTYKFFQAVAPGGFTRAQLAGITQNTRSSSGLASFISILVNNTNTLSSSLDLLTGKLLAMPCRVIVQATASSWHLRGRLPDIKMLPITAVPSTGLTLRDGFNNITHVLIGCLWIPCDGLNCILV
jgi:hypothetical protein